jgi:fucose permease
VLTVVSALSIFIYGLMSPLLGALLPSYGLNSAQQGSLGFANALGLVIASLLAGPLVDSKGKKLGLLIGLSLIGLTLVTAPRAAGTLALLGAYFTLGIGGGTISTSANALVGDIAPERRGSALNLVNLFFGLGGVITTLAASYLLTAAALCYFIAALGAGVLVLTVMVPMAQTGGQKGFRLNQVPGLVANPTLIGLCALLFLYVACEVGVWNWLKIYLISIHFPAQTAGGIVSYGFAFGILLGRAVVSKLLLRTSALKVIGISSLLIACATFAMLNVHSQKGVTITVFCSGLAMAAVFPTTLSIAGDQFPNNMATAMGIAITSGWLGLAISSPIVGLLAERSSLRDALLLLPGFALAMVLVTLLLFARLRKAPLT